MKLIIFFLSGLFLVSSSWGYQPPLRSLLKSDRDPEQTFLVRFELQKKGSAEKEVFDILHGPLINPGQTFYLFRGKNSFGLRGATKAPNSWTHSAIEAAVFGNPDSLLNMVKKGVAPMSPRINESVAKLWNSYGQYLANGERDNPLEADSAAQKQGLSQLFHSSYLLHEKNLTRTFDGSDFHWSFKNDNAALLFNGQYHELEKISWDSEDKTLVFDRGILFLNQFIGPRAIKYFEGDTEYWTLTPTKVFKLNDTPAEYLGKQQLGQISDDSLRSLPSGF